MNKKIIGSWFIFCSFFSGVCIAADYKNVTTDDQAAKIIEQLNREKAILSSELEVRKLEKELGSPSGASGGAPGQQLSEEEFNRVKDAVIESLARSPMMAGSSSGAMSDGQISLLSIGGIEGNVKATILYNNAILSVKAGQDIGGGTRVISVNDDHIVVSVNGRRSLIGVTSPDSIQSSSSSPEF